MRTTTHSVVVCRCFPDDRTALRDRSPRPVGVVREAPDFDSESSLALRPDVNCLQRWLDLNA